MMHSRIVSAVFLSSLSGVRPLISKMGLFSAQNESLHLLILLLHCLCLTQMLEVSMSAKEKNSGRLAVGGVLLRRAFLCSSALGRVVLTFCWFWGVVFISWELHWLCWLEGALLDCCCSLLCLSSDSVVEGEHGSHVLSKDVSVGQKTLFSSADQLPIA
ncbi:hypothetical protein GBAR_LOCUS3689, partial [Geodia barretti]